MAKLWLYRRKTVMPWFSGKKQQNYDLLKEKQHPDLRQKFSNKKEKQNPDFQTKKGGKSLIFKQKMKVFQTFLFEKQKKKTENQAKPWFSNKKGGKFVSKSGKRTKKGGKARSAALSDRKLPQKATENCHKTATYIR